MTKCSLVLALALLTGVACFPCLAQTTESGVLPDTAYDTSTTNGGLTAQDFAVDGQTGQTLTYDSSIVDPLATGFDQLNTAPATDLTGSVVGSSAQGQPEAPRTPHAFRGFLFGGAGSTYRVVTLFLGGPQGSGGGMIDVDGQPLRLVQAAITTQASTAAASTDNVILASVTAQVVTMQAPTATVDATGTSATAQIVGTLQGTIYLRGGAAVAGAQPVAGQPRGPRPSFVFEGVLQGSSLSGSILALGEGGPGPRGLGGRQGFGQGRGQGRGTGMPQGIPQNTEPGF